MTKALESELLEIQNRINSLELRVQGLLINYFESNRNLNLNIKTIDLIPFSGMLLLNRLTRFETSVMFENIHDKGVKKLLDLIKLYTKEYYILKY